MTVGIIRRTLHALDTRDPARERLRRLVAVTSGICASLLLGYSVVHYLHAESSLLTISVFLSLMSGLFVKDPTPRGRVVTTGLLIPLAAGLPIAVASMTGLRPLQLAGFVLVAGLAMWLRRFGPRATTLGSLGFFVYFFTLLMRPTPSDLPAFCLIAAGAVTSQFLVQLVLRLLRRPERELAMLLRELALASASAVEAAGSSPRPRAVEARLTRVEAIWQAITEWQQEFDTRTYTDTDHDTLAAHVLDTCVNTEKVCLGLLRPPPAGPDGGADGGADRQLARSLARAALSDQPSTARLEESASQARNLLASGDRDEIGPERYRLAELVLAHARLRAVELRRRPAEQAHVTKSEPAPETPSPHPPRRRWTPWREWRPTSRLAIQAMAATAIASTLGEVISASRWYWAVLTAFLVFVSTTTRSGVLTRAYRRVTGTVLGLAVGIGATYAAHDVKIILLAICVLAVMGMIYFGPLNYMYQSFFITVLLVSLYAVLGVLDGHLLEVRLEETLAGAIVGVLCAYLLLSANSRPALVEKVDAYFSAVDALLREGADLVATAGRRTEMLERIHQVESAQADLDQSITAMSTAFLLTGRDRVDRAVTLIQRSTRPLVRFAHTVLTASEEPGSADASSRDRIVLQEAVAVAREVAEQVRDLVDEPTAPATPDRDNTLSPVRSTSGDNATVAEALSALDRFSWVMGRLGDLLVRSDRPSVRRRRPHLL